MDAFLKDISEFKTITDYSAIVPAAMFVELITLFLVKYAGPTPSFKVGALNDWYDRFGVFAVGADVLSLIIGLTAARYIYSAVFSEESATWSPLIFLLVVILFQLAHDLFFNFAVIQRLKSGVNEMIDVFHDYADENGGKILVADAAMVTGTAVGAMLLKGLDPHVQLSATLVILYATCFILFTAPSPSAASSKAVTPPADKKEPTVNQYQERVISSNTWDSRF